MTDDWKKVERSAHDFTEHKEFIGVFKGKVDSQFELDNFLFDVEGKDVVVFGKTALQNKLLNIEPGTQVKIVYNGEKKSEKTGRLYQDYDVFLK